MSIFPDLPTTQWTKSVKSPFRLFGGTPKWLRSRARAALRVAMLPAAATRTRYLRHFDASNVQLVGPDPKRAACLSAARLSASASPACARRYRRAAPSAPRRARRRSEENTSELQSLMRISSAVFCLKQHKTTTKDQ